MEDLLEEIGKELPPADARETYETLAKILGNILKNPAEVKFRSLKKDNKLIATKILRSNNAASLLLTMGFDDEDGMYRLDADGDLETMRTVHELLECIILSAADQEPSSNADAKASAPAPCSAAAPEVAAVAAVSAVTAVAAAAKPKAAVAENLQGFGRRPAKTQHQEQIDQLAEARAAQRAQYIENPQGPTPVAAPVAQAAGYPAAAAAPAAAAPDAKKKPNQTSFDFTNRNKAEQERVAADQSLAAMRQAQKDKFKDFQSDPNAKQQEAYKQPPSVTAGAKAEDSSWFGGWFGGGSGSDGNSKPAQRPEERRKPNIKGVADLPKPIQRGGG